jgi:hypothetical protein
MASIVALAALAGVGLPSMASFELRAAGPVLAFMRSATAPRGELVSTFGVSAQIDDLSAEPPTSPPSAADILLADYGYLPDVPPWLLSDIFDCSATGVSCSDGGSSAQAFDSEGALVFVQRMGAGPPSDASTREWGPVLRLEGASIADRNVSFSFRDASHVVVTHLEGATREVSILEYDEGAFVSRPTDARSLWTGQDLVTLIPLSDLPTWPLSWDMYAFESFAGGGGRLDSLRESDFAPLLQYLEPPYYTFFSDFAEP